MRTWLPVLSVFTLVSVGGDVGEHGGDGRIRRTPPSQPEFQLTHDTERHQYTGWSPGLEGRAHGSRAQAVSRVEALSGSVFENVKSEYAAIRADILERWGSEYANTTLFSGGMRFSDGGKVVEDKMLNALLEQRGFLAVFTGVSTTAGHDNLYEQSYPIVLNGTMGRLMAAAGVLYEAINVAMGNTRAAPYSFCVDAHAGLEADIISWDMYMMVQGKHPAPPAVELFIRSASVLPRRPAVLLTDATTDNKRCPGTVNHLKMRNERLYAAGAPNDLMEVYRDFGLHSMTPSSLVPENTCEDELFAYDHLYNASLKSYDHSVGWHAGPPGHQLVADMLFMHYAEVFLGAVERLNAAAPGVTASQLRGDFGDGEGEAAVPSRESLRETLGLGPGAVARPSAGGGDEEDLYMGGGRGRILPPPAWCADWMFCSEAGNYRCASSYFPLAGGKGSRLLDMVSERSPATVRNRHHSEYFAEPVGSTWAVTLNEEAPHLIEYLGVAPPPGFHHPIDMKWVLVGDEESGPIEFEFETFGVPPGSEEGSRTEDEEGGGGGAEGRGGGGAEEGKEHDGRQEIVEAPRERGEGAEEDESDNRRALQGGPQTNSVPAGSRLVVCKPDFIDRQDFTNSTQVRFVVDGVEARAEKLWQGFMMPGSCVTLEAEVGIGRHKVTVQSLGSGAPYVAVSHLLYPA